MARPVWSGAISFGLVNVPVKAFTAVRDHEVHFHQIDKKSGARVRAKKVSETTGEEVDPADIEMGYETSKGRYVTFEKDELDALRPASTRAVDIGDFVSLDEIDPIYYDRTYWLAPDGPAAEQAYRLLLAAMTDRRLVGVGEVVMRNKQYLTAIRPLDGALAMSTMRFADEVVPRTDVGAIPKARTSDADPKALKMAVQLVDGLTGKWEPEKYHDTYTEELVERITNKEAKPVADDADDADDAGGASEPSGKVLDLMAALEASLDAAKRTEGTVEKPAKARAQKKKATKSASPSARKRAPRKSA